MSSVAKTVGERIRDVRLEAGLSANQFAKDLGVGSSHISRVERGLTNPSPLMLQAIEATFRVKKEWLETGELPRYIESPDQEKFRELLRSRGREVLRRTEENVKKQEDQYTALVEALASGGGDWSDARLIGILSFFVRFWDTADERKRTWLEVQLERTFPEFEQYRRTFTSSKPRDN